MPSDHDEIAYKAIREADMLIYVVTENLFDNYIAKDFQCLLSDYKKANEMLLLVNKMGNNGNTAEIQQAKLADLKEVLKPYDEIVKTVFIDARDYLDSINEQDGMIKNALYTRSNYNGLVKTIDEFVKEKEFAAKLTTPLQQMNIALNDAISAIKVSLENKGVDMTLEKLRRERKIIYENKQMFEHEVNMIIDKHVSDVKELGRALANNIYNSKSEEEAEERINKNVEQVDKISADCGICIKNKLMEAQEDLKQNIEKLNKNPIFQNIEIELKLQDDSSKESPIITYIQKNNLTETFANRIIAGTVGKGGNGLRTFSDSEIHQVILKIGNKLGKKFKPWEALKYTEKLNFWGQLLRNIGPLLMIITQIKGDLDNEKYQKEMRENRENIRKSFNDAGNELQIHFENILDDDIMPIYTKNIEKIEKQVRNIERLQEDRKHLIKEIFAVQEECNALIYEIQQ